MRSSARRSPATCRPAAACASTHAWPVRWRRRPAGAPCPPSDLAAHFAAAGGLVDAQSTIRYAVAAGDEAAAALAFDLAAEQYERALSAQARLSQA